MIDVVTAYTDAFIRFLRGGYCSIIHVLYVVPLANLGRTQGRAAAFPNDARQDALETLGAGTGFVNGGKKHR